jgi:cellulose synthase/poly-beta-1,6-N-acetylglucosamine synthase-like glycosyltransferase
MTWLPAIVLGLSGLVLLYSYGFYPVLLPLLGRLFGRKASVDESFLPTIGVVIPVYNEELVIERKLQNIFALDYPADRISVWIGSDQSTDSTDSLVQQFGDSRVHLWRAPTRMGKSGIVNELTPQVNAEIVLLTDANTMHRPDSLRKLVRNFGDPRVGAAAGNIEHVSADSGEIEERLYRSFETAQKYNESLLHSSISAFGGFYAIRKRLFKPIPPNAYSNDDVLIPMGIVRQGFRVIFDPEAVSEEDVSGDAKMEFWRRVRIGAGNFQAFFWLLDFLSPFRGWPWFCYVSHKVTRWFSPLFILAGYIAAGMVAYAYPRSLLPYLFAAAVLLPVAGLFHRSIGLRFLRPVFYFFTMNTALLLGFGRYLGGIRSGAWVRTERKQ